MCGKLYCPLISETGCAISSQDDCAPDEVYLYPGLICECCGACLSRTLSENAKCDYTVMNEHTPGCAQGLCCSTDEACVKKTSEYGAP
ncbi:hypothetical protein L9F63_015352 [Diploptera punctata]|uniref:Uncharacterized protein n=1 Tax=Diploptera punctata TaxID=6984 RepID=A0AAD8A746_DIPPU|nr:hypothetical protein L9F63_015352 [Diploptera punctata]